MATEVGNGVLGSVNQSGTRLGDRRTTAGRNLLNSRNATVNDVVASQEESTRVLREINEKLESLGGSREGSSPLSNLFNNNESRDTNQGGGLSLDSDSLRGIGEAVSEGSNNSEVWSRIASNIGNSSDSLGSISENSERGVDALSIINAVLGTMRRILSTINDTFEVGIRQSIANQNAYMGPISTRLQAFNNDSTNMYKEISHNIRDVFTNSRYINQQKLLENLNSLVQTGIGYNLEDRAYLMTIADRTVATFDLLDPSLNRMIRLQQADLTRAQMGLESFLTQGLNSMFWDTSYLNSMYDSVTAALVDATSQMSYEETTSYLYNVQKWLASLYSVGMSENAISQIAQGLNLLGTGNVSQLTGNDQLNTLFAMSAQRAGLSYAQLLTTGVSDENVDKLLRAMVEYLQSIAENTSSEVLRNEYGRVFGGLSVSDLRAVQNLTDTDIKYIDAYKLDMEGATDELAKQISKIGERTHLSTQIENMFNNLIYSIGADVAEDEDSYRLWVESDIVSSISDQLGEFGGSYGELFSNVVGLTTESLKSFELLEHIQNLSMFQDEHWAEST